MPPNRVQFGPDYMHKYSGFRCLPDMRRARHHPADRPHDDLVSLLAKLNEDLLRELRKVRPPRKARQGKAGARCPATHNRALLDRRD